MVRVKRGKTSRKKHKKTLKQTKGYRMTRNRLIKRAKEAVLRADEHAFTGRKQKKRNFRRLWITRISQAVKHAGWSYSRFMGALSKRNIELDRKILADLVVNEPDAFENLVEEVME